MSHVRRIRLVGAACALVMGLALPAAAEPATTSAVGPTAFDYSKVAGLSQPDLTTKRESTNVAMHDGVTLYVEVVRPDAPGTFPVVLEASPYHGTLADRDGTRIFPDPKDGSTLLGLTGYFAPRGYAVVMVDLRGTGRSQGCLDHLGQNDAKDLKRIVEWAAAQPWSNGRVGMTGHSYVGSTPSIAAAQKPRGLVTIAPSAGLVSMYDHQFQRGIPYNLQWVGPQVAYEALALERHLPPGVNNIPVVGGKTGDNFGNDTQYFGCGLPNSAATAGSGQVTGQYEDWHAQRDWRDLAEEIDIPVFMIHGVNDNAARIPAAEWFFDGRTPSPDDKVWLGQWDHGSSGSSSRCAQASAQKGHPNCRFKQWQFALHAWFDKHLAQRDVDTGPPVEVFLNDNDIYAADVWNADNSALTLYADASSPTDQTLSETEPAGAASASFIGSSVLGGVVRFTSAPVEVPTLVTGMPKIRLTASANGPVQLLANVYERSAGGIDTTDPVTVCALQVALRHSVATVSPVIPGQKMTLRPQCFTAAHMLQPGESLVLEISAPRPTSTHHVGTLAFDPQVTIYTGPDDESVVTLPTVVDPVLQEDTAPKK